MSVSNREYKWILAHIKRKTFTFFMEFKGNNSANKKGEQPVPRFKKRLFK